MLKVTIYKSNLIKHLKNNLELIPEFFKLNLRGWCSTITEFLTASSFSFGVAHPHFSSMTQNVNKTQLNSKIRRTRKMESGWRNQAGVVIHKALYAGKYGALAVKSFPPWAFTTFTELSTSQKVFVFSVSLGG